MSAAMVYLMAMSCAIPAIAGIAIYKKLDKRYYLFVHLMILNTINETAVYFTKTQFEADNISQLVLNIYTVLFFALSIKFVYGHGFLTYQKRIWAFIGFAVVMVFNFILENYRVNRVFFYLVCYLSCILIIIATNILSQQAMVTNKKILDNFWFWYSGVTIISSAFTLLIFGLYYTAMFNTPEGKSIANIHHFANMFCQLLFTVAVIKIPRVSN
jgi:hypothetical protein